MTTAEAEAIIALVEASMALAEVGSGAMAYQRYNAARDKLRALVPPLSTIIAHFMHNGATPCGMPVPTATWPKGHAWSTEWEEVNCPACLQASR